MIEAKYSGGSYTFSLEWTTKFGCELHKMDLGG